MPRPAPMKCPACGKRFRRVDAYSTGALNQIKHLAECGLIRCDNCGCCAHCVACGAYFNRNRIYEIFEHFREVGDFKSHLLLAALKEFT